MMKTFTQSNNQFKFGSRLLLMGFGFVALFTPDSAFAISSISVTDLSTLTTTSVSSLLQTAALGLDHRDYQPATPLGMMLGVDIGVDVTAISVPTAFTTALSLATGQSSSNLPSVLLVPKLNLHKGLPMGIDLGLTWISVADSSSSSTVAQEIGGEVQYALVNNLAMPAISARLTDSYTTLYFMSTNTWALDVLMSKNLVVIDPYVGVGMKYWSGQLNVPTGVTGLTVSGSSSGFTPHIYAGLPLKLAIIKMTGEVDYNFAGFTTYGLKLSLSF